MFMADCKKDVLFLCQFFYPEHNSSATLPFDTAKYLASHGFTVDALVGYPKEYSSNGAVPLEECIDHVNIKRIKYIQTGRTKVFGRLVNYTSFTYRVMLALPCLKKYRIVIVYSNPPILPIVPILAKKKYGTKLIFVAYDVYPEVAYSSGALSRTDIISRLMRQINNRLYRLADCVVALTDEMKEFLLQHRPQLTEDRVVTIENWAHEKRSALNPETYNKLGYRKSQFIVSYFGNLGTCQDIDTILEAAELLKDHEHVRFLIVGHGNKKEVAKRLIAEHGLNNVQLLDFLTGEEFEQAVALSSCGIVSLERGLKGTCAPSKYYSYLQGGLPVLAITEKDSYLACEIEKEQIGFAVEPGDAEALRDAIAFLAEKKESFNTMSAQAKRLYERKYTYETAMKKYAQIVKHLCREGDQA